MIQVTLNGVLSEGRERTAALELTPGMTGGEVFKKLGINNEEVAILLVNEKLASPEKELSDGDSLSLFPPVSGG